MSLRKLAGQTLIYGLSSIGARLLNYLLTPYLTWYALTKEQYGDVGYMYALIPFGLIVLTMGLESGYFRFAGKASDDGEKKKIFHTAWGLIIGVSLVFFAVVCLFRPEIARLTQFTDHPSFITMVGAIIAIDAITAIPFASLRERGKAGRYVLIRLISVVINVVFCVFFYSGLPLIGATSGPLAFDPGFGAGYVFLANLIASFATLIILLPSCPRGFPMVNGNLARSLLLYSLPLLLSGIAGTANEFIDRLMIDSLMPGDAARSAVGVYTAIAKIAVVMVLFTQMYRLAAEPYFLAGFKKEDFIRTNAEAMKYFIIVSIIIFLGITYFTDIFSLIVGPEFRYGIYILPYILLANILAGIVLNLSFWYKQTGKTKYALIVTLSGLAFTVGLNIILIPRLGILGASLARLGCELAMVVVSFELNRRFYPIPYDLKRIGQYALIGTGLYFAGRALCASPDWLRYAGNLLLLSSFCYYAARRENIRLKPTKN